MRKRINYVYPRTMLLTLVNSSGYMSKTNKSKLLQRLEQTIDSDDPISVDATLMGAIFFPHT